jgi:hypothetical protein
VDLYLANLARKPEIPIRLAPGPILIGYRGSHHLIQIVVQWMRLLLGLFAIVVLAAPPPQFEEHTIATDLTGGYQVVPFDVNGDGKTDLIALASGMNDLVWFQNPDWQRHVLAVNLPHMINLAAWRPTARAIPDIVVAYEFSMTAARSIGIVSLLRPAGNLFKPWTVTEIDRLPSSHRLRWADIDGSGNKVLINAPLSAADAVAPDFRGHVPLVYYRPGEWKRRLIGDAEQGILHGIFVTDWDHNSRDVILIGSFLGIHLYRFEDNGTWSRTELTNGNPAPWPKSGTSDIAVGSIGKERFIVAIEPWHGNQVVVYRREADVWRRDVIDESLLDAHTVAAADFNNDGEDEIVAGFRGKPYGVYLYSWDGAKWDRRILDQGGVSAAACAVADLDNDGRPDIACIGSATRNLKWYRNLSTGMGGKQPVLKN